LLKPFVKAIVVGTVPALLGGGVADAVAASGAPATPPATPPATQPATQPATRPGSDKIADSDAPLVIPDGTSREHPGPSETPAWQGGIQLMGVNGMRR